MNEQAIGPAPLESRLEELENRLAFQDDTIEDLNRLVARQDREILELKLKLTQVAERLKDFDEAIGGGGAHAAGFEVPPHY